MCFGWGTPTAGPLCPGPRPRARPPLPPSSGPRLPPRARASLRRAHARESCSCYYALLTLHHVCECVTSPCGPGREPRRAAIRCDILFALRFASTSRRDETSITQSQLYSAPHSAPVPAARAPARRIPPQSRPCRPRRPRARLPVGTVNTATRAARPRELQVPRGEGPDEGERQQHGTHRLEPQRPER